jgi:hypothetical protein
MAIQQIQQIKQQCFALLCVTDKYMLEDYPITDAEREKWKTYRAALRTLSNITDPKKAKWPTPPDDI